MSDSPNSPSELSRRNVLRGAAAAGLLATPVVGALAACAGGPTPTPNQTGGVTADNPFGAADNSSISVVIFNGGLGDVWAKEDKTIFSTKRPKITVNMSSALKIATENQAKMATTPPDVINNAGADAMVMATLISENALEPLDDVLKAPAWDTPGSTVADTLLPGTVSDGTFQDKYYAVNIAFTVWGIWYDGKLFDKNGWQAPKTFDEFFALAPKIKAAGIAPLVYDAEHGYYPRWALMATIWKSAGKQAIFDIDNLKADAWKADGILPALSAWEKLVKDKWTLAGKYDHIKSQQAHLDHKAAFVQLGTWYKNEMTATFPADFELKLSDYWTVGSADKDPKAVFAGSGEALVVPVKAPNKAAAKEFLRAVLSKEGSAKFTSLTKSLASTKDSGANIQDPTITTANEIMKGASKDLISVKGWDAYAVLDKESANLSLELMAGRLTAQQFVDKMQAASNKVAADPATKKLNRT